MKITVLQFAIRSGRKRFELWRTNMTQLLRGVLTIGIIAILVFLIVLLYMDLDQPAVEKEECPFAQQDYIYWSKKYKLAWCKVFFPRPNFSKKSQTTAQVPKAGSTTWVYNMLVLAGSPLVNTSSKPLAHKASQTGEELPSDRGEGNKVDQLDRDLSTDDLLHEELRRYYPVPKNLEEVEEQALTFHVVSEQYGF